MDDDQDAELYRALAEWSRRPVPDDADRAVEAWTVGEALKRLPPAHREVLVECYFRGHTIADAASRLSVPPGTVKSRVHYALRALRMALDEMGVTR